MKEKIKSILYNGNNEISLLHQRYLPRWIVLMIDVFIGCFSFLMLYFIITSTVINFYDVLSITVQGFVFVFVNIIFFFVFKTYSGIIRHSSFVDVIKLALSQIFTAIVLLIISGLSSVILEKPLFITTSIVFYTLLSFCFLLFFRIFVKEIYQYLRHNKKGLLKERIAIIGIDDETISLGQALTRESNFPFKLIGFFTENIGSKRLKLLDKPVFKVNQNLPELIDHYNIEGVLFIGNNTSVKEKNKIVEICLKAKTKVYNVPSLEEWNKMEDVRTKIKPIQIEDLLERDIIKIETDIIKDHLEGKTILITGGAGSIGSEIVRQVATFNPKLIVILDQGESPLYELELYLLQHFPNLKFITELANISNMYRMGMLFKFHKFNVVYHAAAYKHVPLIERNPHEAIYVNILGTVNLSVLAVSHKIERFVMVSTDKAVNPTNVMGASKRAAEIYVQALQNKEENIGTKFITTRFGNVLGSNGSVIPHFRKQISEGGPVTVTHKDIIRYFMTIPEACQLVLQAGTMGNGGEIFIFDMGAPVKILDLAKRMIELSGLTPYTDIEIEITGLRPGEKLYEELLNDTSTTLPTHHPKIMISKERVANFENINVNIKKIIKSATRLDDQSVVRILKEIVPEFKSNNSVFEVLDSENES
ncbi:polysaccharide biosynthesis protein [Patiriisocius sp. Uisw_017]|uniref:polysaccharide biosynthesis protein n=1 Tax=Patiriisocius sp. Uisw_017 TaxID=3230968 RepID=UPI0039ED792A